MKRTAWAAGVLTAVALGVIAVASVISDDADQPEVVPGPAVVPEEIARITGDWPTDWDRRTIDLGELTVGLPQVDPRDAIAPIDDPVFEDVAAAGRWLDPRDPGVLLEMDGDARFYPLRILSQHEIVNDRFGEVPVVVSYCPLCNSATAFDRRIDGSELRFGASGLLRFNDLVMWDDATVSLWQQIGGEAIVGELAGTRLEPIPVSVVRWADFQAQFPDGGSLSRGSGFGLRYERFVYEGYSSAARPRGFPDEELDPRWAPLERVVGVAAGGESAAYPFPVIRAERVVNDRVGGVAVVVVWGAADTADALDRADIGQADSIGTGVAYLREVAGRTLTFEPAGDTTFADVETATTWSILGVAVEGPLVGEQLTPAIHSNEFWFAWSAFNPEGRVLAP